MTAGSSPTIDCGNGTAEAEACGCSSGETRDLARLTYLIIDDSRYARWIVQNALSSFGLHRIREAENAIEGLAILESETIDFILVDHDMPGLNGTEFTRLVRRGDRAPCPEIPIIMVSGFADHATLGEALRAGVHEFVAKPFAPAVLVKRIRAIVERPRPFVRSKNYIGPERRISDRGSPEGTDRRSGTILPQPAILDFVPPNATSTPVNREGVEDAVREFLATRK